MIPTKDDIEAAKRALPLDCQCPRDVCAAHEKIAQAIAEARAKNAAAVPVARVPLWGPLHDMIIENVEHQVAHGETLKDFEHYAYEMAVQAVYGDTYFAWRNRQGW